MFQLERILYCIPVGTPGVHLFSSHHLCRKEILLSFPFYIRKQRFREVSDIPKVVQRGTEP